MNQKQEAVFAAAQHYFEQTGNQPTNKLIHERIGGSFADIAPALREWKHQHRQSKSIELEMPQEVQEGAQRMAKAWWQSVTTLVSEQITSIQAIAAKQVEEAQIEAAELLSLLNEHQQKLECALAENDALKKCLSQTQKETEELKADYRVYKEKSATHVTELQKRLKTARETSDAYKKLEQSYLEQIAILRGNA